MKRFVIGSPRVHGEGLRIGAVRYLPRGKRKEDYAKDGGFDVWLPTLAPSRALMARGKPHRGECNSHFWHGIFAAYEREMRKQADSRQTIALLARLSRKTPISVGCYCQPGQWCHVTVLMRLLEEIRQHPDTGLGRKNSICRPGRGRLYAQCVYTLLHPDHLEEISGTRGAHELERGREWTTAERLVEEAMLVDQRVPVVFGDATKANRLTGWGMLECTGGHEDTQSYQVSGVRKLYAGHRPQDLVLVSKNRRIRPEFIRPYAICWTPKFLKARGNKADRGGSSGPRNL